jgi:hypothetical protein
MPERPTTTTIIMKIEETQKLMGTLIDYYKYLEDILKGTPTRKYAVDVRKYFERLKNNYLERFKHQMKILRDKAKKEEKKRIEEAKRREEEARKLREQAKRFKIEAKKIRRI